MQNVKVSDQSVPKTEWKQTKGQTDGGECITSLANAVGKNECVCIAHQHTSTKYRYKMLGSDVDMMSMIASLKFEFSSHIKRSTTSEDKVSTGLEHLEHYRSSSFARRTLTRESPSTIYDSSTI